MSKHSMVCAGIDIGKHKLDVALDGSPEQLEIDNATDGHAELSAWLERHQVKRVGIEASGGYEQDVVIGCLRDELLKETLFRLLPHTRAVLEAWRADYDHSGSGLARPSTERNGGRTNAICS
jgi:transposase